MYVIKIDFLLECITVGSGLHAGGIIWPSFSKNETRANVTANGERYPTMINEHFFKNMYDINLDEM